MITSSDVAVGGLCASRLPQHGGKPWLGLVADVLHGTYSSPQFLMLYGDMVSVMPTLRDHSECAGSRLRACSHRCLIEQLRTHALGATA